MCARALALACRKMTVSVKYVRKNPVLQGRRSIIRPCDHIRVHRARGEDLQCTLHGCSKPLPVFACRRVHQCVRLRTSSPCLPTYSWFCDAAGFIFGKHEHSLPPDTCMSCRRSQCFCMGCTGGLCCLFVFISCEHGEQSLSTSLHGSFRRRASASVSSRSCNRVFSALNSRKHACMCNAQNASAFIHFVRAFSCCLLYTCNGV